MHNYVRDALYALARSLGLEPGWETPGLVEGAADRPADVLIPKHVSHGLGREPAHAALDACIDVSGVCSLCDSYVRLPVLQPLYERSQLKMRRGRALRGAAGLQFHWRVPCEHAAPAACALRCGAPGGAPSG